MLFKAVDRQNASPHAKGELALAYECFFTVDMIDRAILEIILYVNPHIYVG